MKIFSKFYARRLYRSYKLEEILTILDPWIDEVLYFGSPFLRQIASYHLRLLGGSSSPRFFKTVLGNEILRLTGLKDLKAFTFLSIIEAFRIYNPSKGNVNLVTWLAWRVPYELSKLVTWKVTHPIGPFEEAFLPPDIEDFERTFTIERQVDILSKDLKLEKQTKYYYLEKVKEKNAAYC